MGEESVWGLMLRFSGPAIVSMAVAASYNLVDAIFVGRLGTEALAAMTVTFPLVLSLVAIASGTAVGVTSFIGRSLGAGDQESADRAAGISVTLGFVLSAVVAAFCLPLLDSILRVLGATEAVLPLARDYMWILLVFYLFFYLSLMLGSIIRADGRPVLASTVSICSGLLNIALDPVFIFGWGPIPALGIRGAAVATVIAQAVSTVLSAGWIVFGGTGYAFRPHHFALRWHVIAAVYRVGAAALVRSGAQFVAMGVVNNVAASFGLVPLAVVGVLVRSGRFIQMPLLGLGQGIMPVISYNHGAHQKARVAEIVFKMALAGSVWAATCWVAIMLFPTQVMTIFSGDDRFLAEGAFAIRLFALVSVTMGLQTVPVFFFQGIGEGLPATVLTATQSLVFLIVPVVALSSLFGATGLWIAFPVADVLATTLGVAWMTRELRRQGTSFWWWRTAEGSV